MTRDDIISMARDVLEECDGKDYYDYIGDKIHWWGEADAIIKFAELVAEATREHSAKMLAEEGWLMAATLVRVKK